MSYVSTARYALVMSAAVLCICATAPATISFTNNTLTYSSSADLDTVIDPPGLNNVTDSFGLTKAAFQALNPRVIGFNGAPAPGTPLNGIVASYSAAGTVTFTFAVSYNYGSYTSYSRGAFSGSVAQDAMSTAPSSTGGLSDWLDATITTTGGKGVQALGFCVCFRDDQAVDAGQAIFTLSDATTETVALPSLGWNNTRYVFIGYQAPAGKTITRVQASHTAIAGGGWVTIDDLSFAMSGTSGLVGDINGDGYVNVGDLQLLVAAWGQGPGYSSPEDVNGDGFVNVGDLQSLVAHWGQTTHDTTAPAAVTNQATSNPTSTSVTLTWTAPGDDGSTGTADSYDIRYRTDGPVTDANWASATQVTGEPAPAPAGTSQNMTINGLSASTTYYFAVRTSDEVPNVSAISNSPSGTTLSAVMDASISIATGYDDAWENGSDGWVQHCKNLRSSWVNKSDGLVLHIGDSITYANAYGQWARSGSGQTAADTTICSWMHATVWGSGSNNSTNGWYLAAWDVPGRNGSFTAKSSMRTYQYIAGNFMLPSVDQMFTPGFTNPDGKQYRDAQVCILMLGTNDATDARTAAAVAADLDTIIRGLEAADVIVAISTLPPRNGMDSTIQAYNAEIRSLAQRKRIPLIDYYQEIVRRRPGGSWMNTLISSDGVHPSGNYGGSTATSDPYANSGAALSNSGYLLRDWLSVQKINEIKTKVFTTATTWNVSTTSALQSAAASYAAGDTIVVAAGTYYPSPRLTFNRGGVTIRGATGNRDNVILSGPGMLVDAEPREMLDVYSDDVTIKDLTVQNVLDHGIHVRGEVDADRTRIQNVKIIDCGERFIKGSSNTGSASSIVDSLLVEGCYLEQITDLSGPGDNDYIGGIDMMGLNSPTIRNCTFKNIRGATGGGRGGIFLWQGVNNPTIERNTFIGCDRGLCIGNPSGPGHAYMPGYHATGGILRNNMVTRGVDIGMELCFTKDLKVYYNSIYSADASYSRTVSLFGTTTNLRTSCNVIRGLINSFYATAGGWTSTGDITGSTPATNWFVDPTNGNLHLTASATPAFNVGVLLPDVPADFDGQTRGATPDVGADEY